MHTRCVPLAVSAVLGLVLLLEPLLEPLLESPEVLLALLVLVVVSLVHFEVSDAGWVAAVWKKPLDVDEITWPLGEQATAAQAPLSSVRATPNQFFWQHQASSRSVSLKPHRLKPESGHCRQSS